MKENRLKVPAYVLRVFIVLCMLCLSVNGYAKKRAVKVIEPKYDNVANFCCDRLWVFNKSLGGVVDTEGNEILPCVSPSVVHEYSGLNGVAYYFNKDTQRGTLIDRDGKKVAELPEGVLSNTFMHFNKGILPVFKLEGGKLLPVQKWGMIDTYGNLIVPTIYNALGTMREGFINAYLNGMGGYILPDGSVVHQFVYDAAYPFYNGLAKVGRNEHGKLKFGLIDKDGNLVTPIEYDFMQDDFSDGLKKVGKLDTKSGKWSYGFIDTNGNVAIPLKFSQTGVFNDGLCSVCDKEHKAEIGFINKDGDMVIPFVKKSDMIGVMPMFSDGLCIMYAGKVGVIDKSGNVVVPFEYDNGTFLDKNIGFLNVSGAESYLRLFVNGLVVLKYKGKWGVFGKTGKDVIPAVYDQIVATRTHTYFFVKQKGKWGMVDAEGNMILSAVYQDLKINDDENMVCYKENNKWGFMKLVD